MTTHREKRKPKPKMPIDPKTGKVRHKDRNATNGNVFYVPSMSRPDLWIERKVWPFTPKELREWCKKHNYSLAQIAREVGVGPNTVCQWKKLPPGLYMALKYILIRDANRYNLKTERRKVKQRNVNRRVVEKREARRQEIAEGGGIETEPDSYL